MKRKGSQFEYGDQRDRELMDAYHAELSACGEINLTDVVYRAVNRPCSRFWVSDNRTAIVLSRINRGNRLLEMRPLNREMYFELYRRYLEYKKAEPDTDVREISFHIVAQPAPKFYLQTNSAIVIIHHIKKRWSEERKRVLHGWW
jgi:hypothetical protein